MSGPFLNAAYYQNLPHDEVNWAQLAQQWIAMRETQPVTAGPPPQQHHLVPRPALPHMSVGNVSGAPLQHTRPALLNRIHPAESHQPWPNYPPGNNFSEVNPQANRPPWPTYQSNGERPPVIHKPEGLRHPSQLSVERNTYEFSAAIDAPQKNYESEYMTTTADWGKAAAPYYDPQISTPTSLADPFGLGPNPVSTALFPGGLQDVDYRKLMPDKEAPLMNTIDMQKRKILPSWIREGLEKVEREKQKQREKEEQERLAQEEAERRAEEMRAAGKSKFESDSGSDSEAEDTTTHSIESPKVASPVVGRRSGSRFHSPSPQPYGKSTEELREEMLGLLRKWMTEVLMDVTNEETERIAQEVYKSERSKAPAKMLKSSSALAALSGLGSGYDSDTNAEEEDEESGRESIDKSAEQNVSAHFSESTTESLRKSRDKDCSSPESEKTLARIRTTSPSTVRSTASDKRNGTDMATSQKLVESDIQVKRRSRSKSPARKSSKETRELSKSKKKRHSSTSSSSDSDTRRKSSRSDRRDSRKDSKRRDSRRSKSPSGRHHHHRQSSRERRSDDKNRLRRRSASRSRSRSPVRSSHKRRRSGDRRRD